MRLDAGGYDFRTALILALRNTSAKASLLNASVANLKFA